MRRNAFTLIELLVVVAVIGLLTAILMPSLRSAKVQAKRTVCGTNLRQIGVAMQSYLNENNDRFPYASFMPSMGPGPFGPDEPTSIADVLRPYVTGNEKVFHCPADLPGRTQRTPPNIDRSYYESEGSSYEYRRFLAGRNIDELANRIERFADQPAPTNTIWIMRDYNNFHTTRSQARYSEAEAPAGEEEMDGGPQVVVGQRNYLYVDGHVADFEKF